MHHAHHHHNHYLVVLSVLIAAFASYTALDLVQSVTNSKGKVKSIWLFGSSLAMGIGIWSMHFIGMLAFTIPGLDIYYNVPLLVLSIFVAILASALALHIVASLKPTTKNYLLGSFMMGSAIAGMHYIGIASMRIPATIIWNQFYVILSIIIAFIASFGALLLSFKFRDDMSGRDYIARGIGGIIMGIAISGMHYTGMLAMTISIDKSIVVNSHQLLATEGLATAIILGTLAVLGIALAGSNIERALFRKTLLNTSLEAGIKARDEFLSIASHELKTPLTVIKLNVEASLRHIERGDWNEERFEASLHKTNKSLNRIIRLVNDMLDVARIGAGKLSLNKELTDLEIIIEDVIESMAPEYAAAGIPEIKFHPVKAKGMFDVFRIEQVFINLLSNALKYGQGNPVEVIMKLQNPNNVIVSVKDQGFGISEENQKKIFERFERVNSPNEIAGLGLGLSIVEELVKSHGGNIWVESELGKGSTFCILFPLS